VNAAGDTAVHAAFGSPPSCYLAGHGAQLDVKNKQGRTPLDTVLRNREGNPETIAPQTPDRRLTPNLRLFHHEGTKTMK
jgi:hypothetical protein